MDSYIYMITALLPLAAAMLVFQVNPYHALVIRGVLGAIAALVYTVLGAPDVALTEALVGTLLAITLYAVAVRSSLVLRLGVLKAEMSEGQDSTASNSTPLQHLVKALNTVFSEHHLRVELVPYFDREELHRALMEKEVHATCERGTTSEQEGAIPLEGFSSRRFALAEPSKGNAITQNSPDSYDPPYRTITRLRRHYDIMSSEVLSPITQLSYVDSVTAGEVQR
jgi:putative multicomponent Na+:H+ antiporter subunit B